MGCSHCDNFDPEPVGVEAQDEGVTIVAEATILDFVGPGVTVTDGGGGKATITIPGIAADTKQVFRYTVTGAEANPFPVALPAVRASANYNVQYTNGGPQANAFVDYRPLVVSFANNAFNVECSIAPQAGDVLMFTVEDLT